MHLEDVAVKTDLRAVVELGVASVAADVKIALVVARDELEAHGVGGAWLGGVVVTAELVDEEIGGFGGGGVSRRDDGGVAHDHEALAVGCLVRKANEGLERGHDEAVARVVAVQAVEQDDAVNALATERLTQDLLERAVAGAPRAQADTARVRFVASAVLGDRRF